MERAAKAENDRTVTIRPAPDTMTYLTALLPVAQGVSVYAALRREADTRGDGRPRGQVMADTLVERVTGRRATVPTPVAVNLVLSDETLLGGADAPGEISGYGPIPAAVARRMVANAAADLESRARLFPQGLARFIGLRDATTHSRGPTAARPARATAWGCASTATTSRKRPAGR